MINQTIAQRKMDPIVIKDTMNRLLFQLVDTQIGQGGGGVGYAIENNLGTGHSDTAWYMKEPDKTVNR